MTKRSELLQRASKFSVIPNNRPKIKKMSDDELENYVVKLEKSFEIAITHRRS